MSQLAVLSVIVGAFVCLQWRWRHEGSAWSGSYRGDDRLSLSPLKLPLQKQKPGVISKSDLLWKGIDTNTETFLRQQWTVFDSCLQPWWDLLILNSREQSFRSALTVKKPLIISDTVTCLQRGPRFDYFLWSPLIESVLKDTDECFCLQKITGVTI